MVCVCLEKKEMFGTLLCLLDGIACCRQDQTEFHGFSILMRFSAFVLFLGMSFFLCTFADLMKTSKDSVGSEENKRGFIANATLQFSYIRYHGTAKR